MLFYTMKWILFFCLGLFTACFDKPLYKSIRQNAEKQIKIVASTKSNVETKLNGVNKVENRTIDDYELFPLVVPGARFVVAGMPFADEGGPLWSQDTSSKIAEKRLFNSQYPKL